MTAVVGIMNKRGVAIAADSAVTMVRHNERKIANTANKMLRLSSAQPVSIMITGNATFLGTPWDVIIRRYRQKRGHLSLPTVEAVVNDFLAYIPTEKQVFDPGIQESYVYYIFNQLFDQIEPEYPFDIETDDDDNITNLDEIVEEYQDQISMLLNRWNDGKIEPAFKDYSFERFLEYTSEIWNIFVEKRINPFLCDYPEALFDYLREDFLELAYIYLIHQCDLEEALLVFSGFGADEEYPSLIAVRVNEGFDSHICYRIGKDDIVHITDQNETAICPFAQTDIMDALLTGIHPSLKNEALERNSVYLDNYRDQVSDYLYANDEITDELEEAINQVKSNDLSADFQSFEEQRELDSKQSWLKALKNYDLQNMARLAENLVAITGFERHMTFQQEGVGGPIDLAVITKNDGFIWLNRKSWYNHQDVGGRYGKFGV